jgi:hypothetical protein
MLVADELLTWIAEEARERISKGERAIVPIQVLFSRLSILNQGELDMTRSTVLSLKSYDKASFFRILKELSNRDLISFVDKSGKVTEFNPSVGGLATKFDKESSSGFVTLTEGGVLHCKSIFQKTKDKPATSDD